MSEDLIVLQSQDGTEFTTTINAMKKSETITNLVEDAGTDNPVPLPNVTSNILQLVVEWCKYHTDNPEQTTTSISEWDLDYCSRMDQATLFEIILAANYLDIAELLDLTCKTIANIVKGKTPDQIREIFKIERDFTPEEEEAVRKENEWCEEN